MTPAIIHVRPDETFEGWIVQDDGECNLGHFPTREAAEIAAKPLAKAQRADLLIHLPDGRTIRESFGSA